ncbi:MAG: hypothetical protein LLF94_10345 [Chlamydiales bacterium]|nr:hypothetical protein [Chlamydiales bacterium]
MALKDLPTFKPLTGMRYNNMNYSGLSAYNQSNVRLDFLSLEKAVPGVSEQVLEDISYDTFTYLPHDKAIAIVNALAQKGLFVPLPIASMVISKFCDARRGDVVDYIKMGIRSSKKPITEMERAEAKLELEGVEILFKEFPQFETVDKIARERFSAYFAAREFERAALLYMPCLDANWVTAKTFEVIIMGMAQANLAGAVELYARKFDQNHNPANRKFELNFHKGQVSSHGSQEYGAEKNLLVQVKLWHLFCKIKNLATNFPRDTVNICIITGKGKAFRLKNYVLKYLKEHFSWDMKKYNESLHTEGQIRVSTMVKFLMSANKPIPPKIEEDLS